MNGRAWQVLRDLEAWQITQIPRRPHARQDSAAGQDQADLGATQRLQALVSAFHYGAPVAFGWMREQAGGPVRVLAAGPALVGGADGGQVVLTFPAGARAQPLPPGQAAALLARMPCWMQLAGITDALLAGHGDARTAGPGRPAVAGGRAAVGLVRAFRLAGARRARHGRSARRARRRGVPGAAGGAALRQPAGPAGRAAAVRPARRAAPGRRDRPVDGPLAGRRPGAAGRGAGRRAAVRLSRPGRPALRPGPDARMRWAGRDPGWRLRRWA